jgi:hypothetical protein
LTKILLSKLSFCPVYNNWVHNKNVTFTNLNRRLAHKLCLIAAATLVLIASGAKAETQSSKGDKLLVAPILSDSDSSTPKQSKAGNSPSLKRDKRIPADVWTTPSHAAPRFESYWNPLDIDSGAGADAAGRSKKFGHTSPPPGSASSFDKLKIGDSYLGVETQRRLQTRVPSGKVDCATDEECEDYSALPKSKSRGSVGTNSSNILHSRKPFFGLSITTPIE